MEVEVVRRVAKKKVHKVGTMPDFSDCQDLQVMKETLDWLKAEEKEINLKFRYVASFEETCRIQGRAILVDEMLKKFKVSKQVLGDEKDDDDIIERDKYAL